ncbi:hypothetical protein Tco_1019005 [Tanacetum coccineum]|uniref:Xylulose kinase-1 n=1 Tax=Tanacetum coccineum TaxID=301880 RepID=A0ABQ5FW62_9ASTR
MATLKFADTHNLVAFLSKSTVSDGFEQIVDCLNAHPIKYALTVNPTIYTSCIEHFWSTVKVKTINGESQLHALVDGKKIIITKASVRRDLQLADENDEAVHKELGDSLVRATTTASSLEVEQDSGNITKTRSKATPNKSGSHRTNSGGGPRCQETMGDTIAQIRVLDLENTKTTQQNEIDSLKRRVKKLEQKKRSRTHKLKRLRKVGATARVVVKGVNERSNVVEEVVEVINTAKLIIDAAQVSVASDKVSTASAATNVSAATTTTADDLTLAQALQELKCTKPKMKGVVIQELGDSTTTISLQKLQVKSQSQDRGKGILVEEPVKPTKKKDQIRLDKEIALRLQAEFDEEERLARENAQKEEEANIALIETLDDIQAKIDADHQLAKSMQAHEQEELAIEEKDTLFQQLLEKRRQHFAAKRAEEKRNKPPTRAQ